jgi:hypothetical protein
MKKFVAVTTFNKAYYDGLAKRMIETFVQFWPKEVELVCYLEDMDSIDIDAPNVRTVNVFEQCNPELQSYLDFIGTHFSRGFAYKAFTFVDAARNIDADQIIYLDADSVTYNTITMSWLESLLPDDKICAYMGVTMNKGKWKGSNRQHSDSGIYWFNRKHPYANNFIDRYENIYVSRDVKNDKERFPKPNDAYVLVDCIIDAQKHSVESVDFHPQRKALSPLKETILGNYFRHFKAARKNDPEMDKFIDKITAGEDPYALEDEHKGKVNLKESGVHFVREWKKQK